MFREQARSSPLGHARRVALPEGLREGVDVVDAAFATADNVSVGRGVEDRAMRVFDSIERSDSSPARHTESTSVFYNRVAGAFWDQIRDVVEDWFTNYACEPQARSDMRARLRKGDDRQFQGAFLELYLHASLRCAGFEVECHPTVAGTDRRPDFLATRGGQAFFLEAKAVVGVGEPAEGRRLAALYDGLNKLRSPNFFLAIDVEKQGPRELKAGPVRRELEVWLATLDADLVAARMQESSVWRDLPKKTIKVEGWEISFRALPKKQERRGDDPDVRPIGIYGSGRAAFIDDVSPLRRALQDKGSAYGVLPHPYVVAIGTQSMGDHEFDVLNTLYGTEQVQFLTTPNGVTTTRTVRAPDGYWYRGNHWSHPSVAGVLIVNQLHPGAVARVVPTLWDHPEPRTTFDPPDCWARATPTKGELQRFGARVSPAALFGLGEGWPVGEPFA